MDLAKQIDTSLLLDNYCMDDNLQLATSYLTPADAMSNFTFLSQTRVKNTSCGCGKDVSLFKKGQIHWHVSSRENIKGDAETTQTGLRTVQYIIKNWKDGVELLSWAHQGKKRGR